MRYPLFIATHGEKAERDVIYGEISVIGYNNISRGNFFAIAKKYRTFELRDKGIEICYWKLSYRRRLIRTLWFIPIAVIELVWFYFTFKSGFLTCVIGILCGGELIIQLVYNYRRWKNGDEG